MNVFSKNNTAWLKGFSALAIMVSHFLFQLDGYPRILKLLSVICVSVFLFLSGYGINESYKEKGLDGYWERRLKRVLIPYWIVMLVQLPFWESFSMERLLHNLLFTDGDLWFIDFIVRWYIVYWIVRRFVPKHTTLLLIAFGLYCIFLPSLESGQAFCFFFGYLVSEHRPTVERLDKKKQLGICAAALAYGVLFAGIKEIPAVREWKGTLPFNLILLNTLFPISVSLLCLPALLPQVKRFFPMQWLAPIAYELYIVHYLFMSSIEGSVTHLFLFIALSLVISIVFHYFNKYLLHESLVRSLCIIFYVGICYLLACKYVMRVTDSYAYVLLPYLLILTVLAVYLTGKKTLRCLDSRVLFFICLGLYALAQLVVQYHFDPLQNNVDRWSAIAYPLQALFDGRFPYTAPTHLDGRASPFPVWMAFHIPFYLLGNVGLSEIVCSVLFLLSVYGLYGTRTSFKVLLLMAASINIWYEVSVRSDLISNFLLLAAFANWVQMKGWSIQNHPTAMGAACGLWLSTRVTTAFPLFLLFFPSWLKASARQKTMTLVAALVTCLATFLPLIIWDSYALLIAEDNPVSLQAKQGSWAILGVTLLILAILALLLMKKNRPSVLYFCSAAILIAAPLVSFAFRMYPDEWTLIFEPAYDISYFSTALPFLMMGVVALDRFKKKDPSPTPFCIEKSIHADNHKKSNCKAVFLGLGRLISRKSLYQA